MADLASIIAAAADDTEAQRAAVRDALERIARDAYATTAPNAWEATTADDLFAALERDGYSEGW